MERLAARAVLPQWASPDPTSTTRFLGSQPILQ